MSAASCIPAPTAQTHHRVLPGCDNQRTLLPPHPAATAPSRLPLQTPQPSAGGKGGKGKAPLAHALVRYWVPPSAAGAFLDAWQKAEKGTEGEKGARAYT